MEFLEPIWAVLFNKWENILVGVIVGVILIFLSRFYKIPFKKLICKIWVGIKCVKNFFEKMVRKIRKKAREMIEKIEEAKQKAFERRFKIAQTGFKKEYDEDSLNFSGKLEELSKKLELFKDIPLSKEAKEKDFKKMYADIQYDLGMHLYGGVPQVSYNPPNLRRAYHCFKKAQKCGHSCAQTKMNEIERFARRHNAGCIIFLT